MRILAIFLIFISSISISNSADTSYKLTPDEYYACMRVIVINGRSSPECGPDWGYTIPEPVRLEPLPPTSISI